MAVESSDGQALGSLARLIAGERRPSEIVAEVDEGKPVGFLTQLQFELLTPAQLAAGASVVTAEREQKTKGKSAFDSLPGSDSRTDVDIVPAKQPRSDEPTEIDLENGRKVLAMMATKNPSRDAFKAAMKNAGFKISNAKAGNILRQLKKSNK